VGELRRGGTAAGQGPFPVGSRAGYPERIGAGVEAAGEGLGIEAISIPDRPAIPSIIVSMLKIKDSSEGHWVSKNKGTTREWID